MTASEVLIQIQPTPNPNAWKFILDRPVLNEGKATYADAEEAKVNMLASAIFLVSDVRQVHFFQNVITLTCNFDADFDKVQADVSAVIRTRIDMHNPNQTKVDEKKMARMELPPDMQRIEEILDRTVRPGLQGDGGDLTVIRYEEKKVYVHYEGACDSCPSSTGGTLLAIEGILRDEFDPEVQVIPV